MEIVDKLARQRPEKKFRAGPVSAVIWRNVTEKGSYASVQVERSYKDKDTWKSTGSLRVNDLPKAVLVLTKAFDYLVSRADGAQEEIVMEEVI